MDDELEKHFHNMVKKLKQLDCINRIKPDIDRIKCFARFSMHSSGGSVCVEIGYNWIEKYNGILVYICGDGRNYYEKIISIDDMNSDNSDEVRYLINNIIERVG